MSKPNKVHVGEVLGPIKNLPSALDGFNALNQLVDAARECITVHAVESSKQARIKAYETTEVARIRAAESVLRNYFEQVFAERRTNFDGLFTRLDQALEQGNAEVVGAVLTSIVEVARTSPLGDLNDLSQIRAALDDPDQIWDL